MITADTITDKMIRALKREAKREGNDKLVDVCSNALGAKPFRYRENNRAEQKSARRWCAEEINERNERKAVSK